MFYQVKSLPENTSKIVSPSIFLLFLNFSCMPEQYDYSAQYLKSNSTFNNNISRNFYNCVCGKNYK